jgi:hypothetical protein
LFAELITCMIWSAATRLPLILRDAQKRSGLAGPLEFRKFQWNGWR